VGYGGIFDSQNPGALWICGYVYFSIFSTAFLNAVELNASNGFCLPTNTLDFLIHFLVHY